MGRVLVRVPASLREYWGGGARAEVEARTVAEAIAALGPLAARVLDDAGRPRRHVHLFVNNAAIADVHATLREGDILHILPAVSGGFS